MTDILEDIQNLWSRLKSGNTLGLVKQLYNCEMSANIYATYQRPQDKYGIAISYANRIKVDISPFGSLREMSIQVYEDASIPGHNMLLVQLLDTANLAVFVTLCNDLIATIAHISNEKILVQAVVNKLQSWKNLFVKRRNGLSESEQSGLFGELLFLQFCLKSETASNLAVVQSWMGVEKSDKDFQGPEWAVEVKTSVSNRGNKVTINGETQLDGSMFNDFFLCHYALERNNMYGTTLPQLIDEIKQMLVSDIPALTCFDVRLLETGYTDEHRPTYDKRHYLLRKKEVYQVTADFPKIVQSDLKSGVSDVTYMLSLDACSSFLISDNKLLQTIKNT